MKKPHPSLSEPDVPGSLNTLLTPFVHKVCADTKILGNTYPHDKNPLDEGKPEAADGAIASCDGVGQTEGQAEPNPVEQEGH